MTNREVFWTIFGAYLAAGAGCTSYVAYKRVTEGRKSGNAVRPAHGRDPLGGVILLFWPIWFAVYWWTRNDQKERERDLVEFYRRDTESHPTEPEDNSAP